MAHAACILPAPESKHARRRAARNARAAGCANCEAMRRRLQDHSPWRPHMPPTTADYPEFNQHARKWPVHTITNMHKQLIEARRTDDVHNAAGTTQRDWAQGTPHRCLVMLPSRCGSLVPAASGTTKLFGGGAVYLATQQRACMAPGSEVCEQVVVHMAPHLPPSTQWQHVHQPSPPRRRHSPQQASPCELRTTMAPAAGLRPT